jgi:hypothetical protein
MNDPTLPIDRKDPFEQIDRTESSDRHDHFEVLMGPACRASYRLTSTSDGSTSHD